MRNTKIHLKLSDKNSANRVQKAHFMPRCSLFSQIYLQS